MGNSVDGYRITLTENDRVSDGLLFQYLLPILESGGHDDLNRLIE
jgi:hypothetical protein